VALGKDTNLHIRRTHFQVVPADSRIVYAAQGEGFDAYVADLARPPKMSKEIHWLANYVMLSRATSLDAVLITRLCTREELTIGAPEFLKKEVDRLLVMERNSRAALRRRLQLVEPHLAPDTREILQDLFMNEQVGSLILGPTSSSKIDDTQPVKRRRLTGKTAPPLGARGTITQSRGQGIAPSFLDVVRNSGTPAVKQTRNATASTGDENLRPKQGSSLATSTDMHVASPPLDLRSSLRSGVVNPPPALPSSTSIEISARTLNVRGPEAQLLVNASRIDESRDVARGTPRSGVGDETGWIIETPG